MRLAQKFRSGLRRLRRDTEGATAIEFGLIGLPFLAILCAIFELAYVAFEGELLQEGINAASRQMMTGQLQGSAPPPTTAAQFVSTYLCPASGLRPVPSNFNCANLVVDVRPVTSFSAADVSNGIYKTTTQFCPGGPGQTVVMRVTYPLGAIFPFSLFNSGQGVHNDVPGQSGWFHILMAEAMFTEETYGAAYTPPAGC